MLEYRVSQKDSGKTVERLLRERFSISSSLIRSLKYVPLGITLDGEHARTVDITREGQLLCAQKEAGEPTSKNIVPEPGELDILYEDEDLMVLNKPGGIPVHTSRGHQSGTLANFTAYYFMRQGKNFVFRAVNRLDKGTSGVLCLGKSRFSAERLGSLMVSNDIKRTYLAVLEGELDRGEGRIDLPIGRAPGRGIMRCVDPCGQRAVTNYEVLKIKNGYTLAKIMLETGRTHQIRVHFSHLGYPVAGDFMYGTEREELTCHCLHSHELRVRHPLTAENMIFTAEMPQYMRKLIE